jgi:hypothetical protein
MPVYKHIAAQQKKQERADKLRAQKRRRGEDDQGLAASTVVGWSDEDSDDDDEEDAEDDDEDSEGSEEDDDEEDEDEDEEMASGADGSGDDSDDEGLVMDANDPTVPRKPPSGFPTAVEALSDPIASSVNLLPADERPASASKKTGEDDDTEEKEEEDEELPLVCVVCPNKVLKKGKMVQVHLGSKVRSPPPRCCFSNSSYMHADARHDLVSPRRVRTRVGPPPPPRAVPSPPRIGRLPRFAQDGRRALGLERVGPAGV